MQEKVPELFKQLPVNQTRQRRDWQTAADVVKFGVGLAGDLLPVVGPAIGLITSIYNHGQQQEMIETLRKHGKAIDTLVIDVADIRLAVNRTINEINKTKHVIRKLAKEVDALRQETNRDQALQTLVFAHDSDTRKTMTHVQSMLAGKFPPTLLSEPELRRLTEALASSAAANGFELMVSNLLQVLQMPISYSVTTTGFRIILHVPMANGNKFLALYQIQQVPQPLGDGTFVSFQPQEKMLAVNNDATLYKTFDLAELTLCRNLGTRYWCDRGMALQKTAAITGNDPAECLILLFRNDHRRALSACPVVSSGPRSAATIIGNGDVLTANVQDEAIVISCPGRENQFSNIEAVSTVHLDPGCSTSASGWYASAPKDADTHYANPSYAWNAASLAAAIKSIGSNHVAIDIAELGDDIANIEKANIPHRLYQQQQAQLSVLQVVGISLSVLFGTILLAAVGYLLYCRFDWRKKFDTVHNWVETELARLTQQFTNALPRLTGPYAQQPYINPTYAKA